MESLVTHGALSCIFRAADAAVVHSQVPVGQQRMSGAYYLGIRLLCDFIDDMSCLARPYNMVLYVGKK